MRQKIMELKKKTGEASTPSGCSFMNLDKFIKEVNQSRLHRNLMYLAAIADSQPQPSPLAGQQGMHNQLGMSSSGSQGLHMLQSEATNVGGNATIGTGGGFPDFVRIGSGKQDIGISSEGGGGNSSGHSGDGGETLNYLKVAGDGN
ncbi:GRF1-interacting factor 1 [Glycine max]|nr:GRF1-interacting factor 1 [Glycine max]